MSEIVTEKVTVTTTGSAGSATGEGYSAVMNGFLLDIYYDFHTSAPNTTDTTVSFDERGGNIDVIANSCTDALRAPRQALVDNAGAAISGLYGLFPLAGRVKIALAGCDALTGALTAYVRYLRG